MKSKTRQKREQSKAITFGLDDKGEMQSTMETSAVLKWGLSVKLSSVESAPAPLRLLFTQASLTGMFDQRFLRVWREGSRLVCAGDSDFPVENRHRLRLLFQAPTAPGVWWGGNRLASPCFATQSVD